MNYNPKTLKSLENTWIGELLLISDEEIEKALSELRDTEKEEMTSVTDEEHGEIIFPHLLGEINDFEKAMYTLLDRKHKEHREMHESEGSIGISIDHDNIHHLTKELQRNLFFSIQKRYPDSPGDGLRLSKGGKIFATKKSEEEEEMGSLMNILFGGRGRGFGMGIHVVEVKM